MSMCIERKLKNAFPNCLIIKSCFIKQFIIKYIQMNRKYVNYSKSKYKKNKKNKKKSKNKSKLSKSFYHSGIIAAAKKRICICYRGTDSKNHNSIIQSNFVVPDGIQVKHRNGSTFGKGIYMSPDWKIAHSFSFSAHCSDRDNKKVFVCLSLPGRQYNATEINSAGKPLKNGYDSHIDPSKTRLVFFKS